MSSYPDPIAANEAQGPSLVSLRVQFFEERGFMPGHELDKELLDKYWEAIPVGQEGITQPYARNTDRAQLPYHHHQQHQHQHQHAMADMSTDGHIKLVQRRLDLAPFLGPLPAELYSGHPQAPRPTADTESVFASLAPPVMSVQTANPFINHAAPVSNYEVATVSLTAHVSDYGNPINDREDSGLSYGPSLSDEDLPVDIKVAPTNTEAEAAPAAPQARRSYKMKHPWTQTEIDRVVYLREQQNMSWAEIQEASHKHKQLMTRLIKVVKRYKDLGTHTAGSIGDKYWQVVRLSKGLKK